MKITYNAETRSTSQTIHFTEGPTNPRPFNRLAYILFFKAGIRVRMSRQPNIVWVKALIILKF